MIKVSLGASLAFAPLVDCNGAKKETPVVNPEPVNPKLTPKYWQDRLDTLLNQVKEYGDVEFTLETYTPYLEALNRFHELLKKAEQGYLNNYTVGEYELAASNLSAKIANLKVQQKEVNNDPYDTDFALINAMKAFFPKVANKNLSEQEQKQLSDELKKIYVDAFAKDTYSANLPFSSAQLKAAMTPLKYHFPFSNDAYAGYDNIVLGTRSDQTEASIHETGHFCGLGESLTELLKNKYVGKGMSTGEGDFANLNNLMYSPFYDNLLLNRIGDDKKFWGTIYNGSPNEANARYGKMWDENMTVKVNDKKEPLVPFQDFQVARHLSSLARYRKISVDLDKIVSDFEKYANILNIEDEFEKLGPVFENALNNDQKSIEAVRKLFNVIKEYNTDKEILDPIEAVNIKNFLDNMNQYKTQQSTQQTGTVRVNLGQEVGVCR